jgi:hypothetical protein
MTPLDFEVSLSKVKVIVATAHLLTILFSGED